MCDGLGLNVEGEILSDIFSLAEEPVPSKPTEPAKPPAEPRVATKTEPQVQPTQPSESTFQPAGDRTSVSVVIPVYNESESLAELHQRCRKLPPDNRTRFTSSMLMMVRRTIHGMRSANWCKQIRALPESNCAETSARPRHCTSDSANRPVNMSLRLMLICRMIQANCRVC